VYNPNQLHNNGWALEVRKESVGGEGVSKAVSPHLLGAATLACFCSVNDNKVHESLGGGEPLNALISE